MRQLLLLWIFCAFFAQHDLFSQKKVNVDSLTNALNNYPKEDTIKIKMLVELIEEVKKSDTKKAMDYCEIAMKMSERLESDFWVNNSYYIKATILYMTGDLDEAKMYFKKVLSFFEKGNKYPEKVGRTLVNLGNIARHNNDFDTATKHYETAINIFRTTKNMKHEINAILASASIPYYLGNNNEALALYQEAMKKNETLNNQELQRVIYGNMASVYDNLGNYPLSLEYTQKAITISAFLGDLPALAASYNNISALYMALNDTEKTQKYLSKALEIYHKLNDKIGIANAMMNLTVTYEDKKAVAELIKVVKYCKEIDNKALLCSAQGSLAERLYDIKDYRPAYFHAQETLSIEPKDNDVKLSLYNTLIGILLDASNEDLLSFDIEPKQKYEKAKEYLDKTLIFSNHSNVNFEVKAWEYLSIIQEKQNDYLGAYESYKNYVALKDSISGDDVKKQITRKEIQYEFDKKETELKYQQQLTTEQLEKQKLLTFQRQQALTLNQQTLTLKEQALMLSNKEKDLEHLAYLKEQAEKQEKTQELTLSQEREKGNKLDLSLKNLALSAQQKQNLYLTTFAALQQKQKFYLIGFAALLLIGLGMLSYFYTTLKKQKNIIAQQNELNEQTITILSHDIKSPLIGVKLMLKKLNKDDPFVAQASQSLENQINAVNNILNNLLKMRKLALSKKDKNVSANVQEALQNVLQELSVAIQSKDLTIQNKLHDKVLLPIAPEKLQIILHNLLSNAVKYSFPNQSIRIFQEGNGVCIQDFGVGLSPEQRSKIMREVTDSQEGTSQERGNGLGLFIVGAMLQGEQIRVVFDAANTDGTLVKLLW